MNPSNINISTASSTSRVCRLHTDILSSDKLVFRPVTACSMERIMPYLDQEIGRTTDFSYGGVLMWVDYFKYEYCIYKDTLFLKGLVEDDTSRPAFSLPVGKLDINGSIKVLSDYCSRNKLDLEFSAVPEHAVEDMIKAGAKEIIPLDDWGDYLYDIEPMSTFSGKKMAKKRNHVNQFKTICPDAYIEPIDSNNVCEALEFMDIYDNEADGAPMELAESCLTRKMLSLIRYGTTRFEGIMLKSEGKTIGFSIGDIKGDTLFIHIEKATREINGSYEAVAQGFANQMRLKHPELRYINREDDGGDEGLRRSKQSYHPICILKKFNVIF